MRKIKTKKNGNFYCNIDNSDSFTIDVYVEQQFDQKSAEKAVPLKKKVAEIYKRGINPMPTDVFEGSYKQMPKGWEVMSEKERDEFEHRKEKELDNFKRRKKHKKRVETLDNLVLRPIKAIKESAAELTPFIYGTTVSSAAAGSMGFITSEIIDSTNPYATIGMAAAFGGAAGIYMLYMLDKMKHVDSKKKKNIAIATTVTPTLTFCAGLAANYLMG